MPRPTRQRNARHELVYQEILEQAAILFAERGIGGTSLQDIADQLKISRTALYHYVSSKDELLAHLVEGMSLETAIDLERLADDTDLDPVDRLRAAIINMATRVASNPARFRLLLMSESALGEPLATEHHEARRRSLNALLRLIHQGILRGGIRPVDQHVAAFSILGMCNWPAWWYQPTRASGQPPGEMAQAIADLALQGLVDTNDRDGDGQAAVPRVIAKLRADLALLESTLANGASGGS